MPLPREHAIILLNAIKSYCYPKVTYFPDKRLIHHRSMHELEMKIRGQLLSGQLAQVKDGLSNILYWGHFRAGYRDSRVKKFRDKVNDILLKKAAKLFPVIVANGIPSPFSSVTLPVTVRVWAIADAHRNTSTVSSDASFLM